MPSTPTTSGTGIHAVPGADPGLCCPSDALGTTAAAAEAVSPPLATGTEHEVILGTAAAIAVAPSVKGDFERRQDAPRVIGHIRLERRRNRQHGQSPIAILKQLPTLVVLDRLPVPVLAIAHDGTIWFTNTAFAEMVGRERDELLSLRFDQIFHQAPPSESMPSVVHALANTVVELVHKDGSIVRALVSRSALMRADDQFALAVFQDLTKQLWEEEH
jgi:PAS domain S-box-containing protein